MTFFKNLKWYLPVCKIVTFEKLRISTMYKNMFMKRVLFSGFIIILIWSCSNNKESLPPASGLTGDMYLVMDSTQWYGPLGNTIDSLFRIEMAGLPRTESIFRMRWIDPRKLNFVLEQRRNLIFAVTLDAGLRDLIY